MNFQLTYLDFSTPFYLYLLLNVFRFLEWMTI